MSKHLQALRDYADPDRCDVFDRRAAAVVADAFELAERQNRAMRKCLKYIIEQAARPGCQTGATPYDAAEQVLAQCRKMARKAGNL